jgi:hypothetical protein
MVVRIFRPRRAPAMPSSRISRCTVHRATVMPCRFSSSQQLCAGRAAEPGRDHHQCLDSPPSALLGDTEHRPSRDGDDR